MEAEILTDKIFSILFLKENQNLTIEQQKEMVLNELKLFRFTTHQDGFKAGLNKAKIVIEACIID